MPSISELGVGVGDRVRIQLREHLRYGEMREPPIIDYEGEIKRIDESGVYLYPFHEKLGAFASILNLNTGSVRPAILGVKNVEGKFDLYDAPLEPDEILAIALNKNSDQFSLVR